MAARVEAPPKQNLPASWVRDYHRSLVLLAAGVVMIVVFAAYNFWANSTGDNSASIWPGLPFYLIGVGGTMMLLLAGTVAYYHGSVLRQNDRTSG